MSSEVEQGNAPQSPVVRAFAALEQMMPAFADVLPSDVDPAAFVRVVKVAIRSNPALAEVDDRISLFNACTKAAQDGLMPDGTEGVLNIYNTKDRHTKQWRSAVTWIPMIRGLTKRAAKAGIDLRAFLVYENEVEREDIKFWVDEHGEHVEHKQRPFVKDKGPVVGAYALAITPDGRQYVEAMTLEEIEAVRANSKQPDGPAWGKSWGEMARKTVSRRLYKRLPIDLPNDLRSAIERVDEQYDYSTKTAGEVVAMDERRQRRPRGLQAVIDQNTARVIGQNEEAEPDPRRWEDEPPPGVDLDPPEDINFDD